MRVLIIANSPESDASLITRCATEADRIVVADGAVQHLPPGVIPHAICGDFDSIELSSTKAKFPYVDFVHIPDQNYNDLEKAIEFSCGLGATDIVVVSALGGRPDQSFATMSVLFKYCGKVALSLRHAGMACWPLFCSSDAEQPHSVEVRQGATVSVLPYGDGAVVSLTGTEWVLSRADLPLGSLGVSNRAKEPVISVTVHCGRVLLFVEDE
jgi:thiamine pyrophosphokinase